MAIDTVASAVSIAAEGSIGDTIGDSAANLGTSVEMSTLIPLIKQGVVGVLVMASSAFNFLIQNPLCAFAMCVGFGYTALSIVKNALRVAKRT